MKIQTPAKINPLLYILGKREDGFHELYMHSIGQLPSGERLLTREVWSYLRLEQAEKLRQQNEDNAKEAEENAPVTMINNPQVSFQKFKKKI